MHLSHTKIPQEYRTYIRQKVGFIIGMILLLVAMLVLSLGFGAADLSLSAVCQTLLGRGGDARVEMIVWNIRLPQSLAALLAGAGLAGAGTAMQSVLRNPLGSPFTLGISHAAAFGAALSVILFSGSQAYTAVSALVCSLIVALLIIVITRYRGTTPETMVLTGVALGTLFTAGTMVLQFFADDTELASMVFWTFGDTARVDRGELVIMSVTVVLCSIFFLANSWNYNAIESGDETATGLGVRTGYVRVGGMFVASMLTAVLISLVGIIGFVGLIVPHMARRIVGADHRFLLPTSILMGGLLLLVSDTVARLVLAPHVLPVSVLTSFLGAPVFFWLIMRRNRP